MRIQIVLSEGIQLWQCLFLVNEGREDPNTTKSGPSSARQRCNGFSLSSLCYDGPSLNAGLVFLYWFFRGSNPVLLGSRMLKEFDFLEHMYKTWILTRTMHLSWSKNKLSPSWNFPVDLMQNCHVCFIIIIILQNTDFCIKIFSEVAALLRRSMCKVSLILINFHRASHISVNVPFRSLSFKL